jgi:hypothetical protein
MDDIARLGLAIDSTQAVAAKTALNALVPAAQSAATATKSLTTGAQAASVALATLNATSRQSTQMTRQLSFQVIDMAQAIPLAFQSPLYALQNFGFQIAQIGQLYAGQGGMRAALTDMTAMVGRFAARMAPVAAPVALLGAGFAMLTSEIDNSSDASVNFGDVLLGTFQAARDGIYNLLQPAIAAIAPWFDAAWNATIKGVKIAGNAIIGTFVGAYNFIVSTWQNLPDALTGIAKTAANQIAEVLNRPWLTFNGKTIIGGANVPKFELSPAEQGATNAATGSFGDAFNTDFMGEAFDAIKTNAVANALARAAEEAKKAKTETKKFADISSEAWDTLKEKVAFAKDTFQGFFGDIASGLRQGEGLWKSLANAAGNALDSIMSKMLDMATSGIFDQIMGAFGGGFAAASGGFFPGVSVVSPSVPMFHSGRGPGDAIKFTRSLPRFHTGIGPGEMPAVIRKDESVLTPGQMRAMGRTGGGNVQVNVYNAPAGTTADVKQSRGANGDMRLDVTLRRQVDDMSAAAIGSGESAMNSALEQRYGLRPQL